MPQEKWMLAVLPVPDDSFLHMLAIMASAHLDSLLGRLDSVLIPGELPLSIPLEVSRGNRRYTLDLRISSGGGGNGHNNGSIVRTVTTMAAPPDQETTPAKADAPPPGARPAARPGAHLRRVHRKLLEKTSPTDPVTAKALIRLAGYTDNSYSRDALTHLARARLLIRTPDGYLLAPGIQVH